MSDGSHPRVSPGWAGLNEHVEVNERWKASPSKIHTFKNTIVLVQEHKQRRQKDDHERPSRELMCLA